MLSYIHHAPTILCNRHAGKANTRTRQHAAVLLCAVCCTYLVPGTGTCMLYQGTWNAVSRMARPKRKSALQKPSRRLSAVNCNLNLQHQPRKPDPRLDSITLTPTSTLWGARGRQGRSVARRRSGFQWRFSKTKNGQTKGGVSNKSGRQPAGSFCRAELTAFRAGRPGYEVFVEKVKGGKHLRHRHSSCTENWRPATSVIGIVGVNQWKGNYYCCVTERSWVVVYCYSAYIQRWLLIVRAAAVQQQ